MKSRLIDEPAFAPQTTAILERMGAMTGMSDSAPGGWTTTAWT
jgi:hypothetical protein